MQAPLLNALRAPVTLVKFSYQGNTNFTISSINAELQ